MAASDGIVMLMASGHEVNGDEGPADEDAMLSLGIAMGSLGIAMGFLGIAMPSLLGILLYLLELLGLLGFSSSSSAHTPDGSAHGSK